MFEKHKLWRNVEKDRNEGYDGQTVEKNYDKTPIESRYSENHG